MLQENHGGWYYEMHDLGYNYRITDFQAALGRSQLSKANQGIDRRQEIVKRYDEAFEKLGIVKQNKPKEGGLNAHHLFVIEVEDRKGLYEYLRKHNIFSQVHYIPLHLMPYYKSLGWKQGDFPQAEDYYNRCLSLPMYPTLTDKEQNFVIESIISWKAKK
jgi:dTDP-4-amino-4,6-dideoxygalactose transaminase